MIQELSSQNSAEVIIGNIERWIGTMIIVASEINQIIRNKIIKTYVN